MHREEGKHQTLASFRGIVFGYFLYHIGISDLIRANTLAAFTF